MYGKVTAWMWIPRADDQKVRLQNLTPECLEHTTCGILSGENQAL